MSCTQQSKVKCRNFRVRAWIVPLIAVACQLLAWAPGSANGETFYSYVFNKQFSSTYTPKRQPNWKQDTANPPTSARKAWRLAAEVVEQVERKHGNEWDDSWERQLSAIILCSTERSRTTKDEWFWKVQYVWRPRQGIYNGRLPFLIVPIAMDGTVAEPKVHGSYDYVSPENIDKSKPRPPEKAKLAGFVFQPEYDEVVIHSDDLPATPHWNGESQNPPLSAKRALRLSEPVIKDVERRDEELREKWDKSPKLALSRLGKRWYWRVIYTWEPRSAVLSSVPPAFIMAVLMNGKVIAPTPSK